ARVASVLLAAGRVHRAHHGVSRDRHVAAGRRDGYREMMAKLRTPFAVLGIESDGRAITRVTYLPLTESAQAPADRICERAAREVEHYLDDPEFRFTVPLSPGGTAFQQRVW